MHDRLGGGLFTLRIDGTVSAAPIGPKITLTVSPGQLHWFDTQTLRRVE